MSVSTLQYRRVSLIPGLLVGGLLTLLLSGVAGADSRQILDAQAPAWLRAIGALQVPGIRVEDGRRSSHLEDCSATLVSDRQNRPSNTIVTAWHCLEFYRDLSRPITFTLFKGREEALVLEARRLADGGGMHADWAILRLQQRIPPERVAAIPIHPNRADAGRGITMAGYSKDPGLGRRGERLTYDPLCNITRQGDQSSDSDCLAYRGASGGAVVQLSELGEPQLAGVISRGDSEGLSVYVPAVQFRRALEQSLR